MGVCVLQVTLAYESIVLYMSEGKVLMDNMFLPEFMYIEKKKILTFEIRKVEAAQMEDDNYAIILRVVNTFLFCTITALEIGNESNINDDLDEELFKF